MSAGNGFFKGKRSWKEVTKAHPCPKCEHTSWCRVSEEGELCACRRSADGGKECADKNGAIYYLHRLKPSANGDSWPAPQYSLADCPKDEDGNPIRADAEKATKVYRRLLQCLPLYAHHSAELARRGIKDGYKETGYRSLGRERARAVQQLIRNGHEKDLLTVPGFYVAKKNGREYWSLAGMSGLILPIQDAQERILALLVRLDDPPDGKGKYRYLSSRKHGGPGPGAPVHVPSFDGEKSLVRVTEGALKANVATHLSTILTIGLPGVASWKLAAHVLQEIGAKTVRVAFDADVRRNTTVARCLSHLIDHLRDKEFAVELELWNEEEGKGIDDLLAVGKEPGVLTDAAGIDAAIAEILSDAEKADPTPNSNQRTVAEMPAASEVIEAYNDPHLLARQYLRCHDFNGLAALYYHRQTFSRYHESAYRTLHEKEVRAELTEAIKDAFDAYNLKQIALWQAKGAKGNPPLAPKVTREAVGNALQALTGISLLPGRVEPPAWIGPCKTEWAASDMLAFGNTLVHLPSFVEGISPCSIDPTPLFFSANALDYDFDPKALAPVNWYSFLEQLWPDDPQAIEALQEWFGYFLLPDTSQQKILMLIGPKRSGKGTIARVLRALLGIHNVATPTLASLGANFGLQPLLNKTLAIISDARLSGRTDTAVVIERLLSISGEDAQSIDRKYLDALHVRLPVRFMVLTNELPKLNDPSGALVGRMILLRLTKTFSGKEDTTLTTKLLGELPGILLWAIAGWKRLQERGHFQQPESGTSLLHHLEDLGSPVHTFVREKCQVGVGFTEACEDLFEQWKLWCEPRGYRPGNVQTFGRDLRAAEAGVDTRNLRMGAMRRRVYTGIRLDPAEIEVASDPFHSHA